MRLLRQIVEDIGDLVIPALLILSGWMDLAQGRPQAEVTIGHREPREHEPAVVETAQEREPALLALALAALAILAAGLLDP